MGSLDVKKRVYDPSPLFSHRVQRWEPGAIRSLLPLEATPGMISLVAGKPDPTTFPVSSITIMLKNEKKPIVLEEAELREGLQYGLPAGNQMLIEWFEGLQRRVHGLNRSDSWTCCVGNGSQELIHRAFHVFTDPGDPVLLETPAYPGVVGFLRADAHELVEVATDAEGLDPSALELVLQRWPRDRRRPSVLYTVPTGSNPTGLSCSEERKAKVLRLAKRFGFVIFEDDAYCFLNFEESPLHRARSYLALELEINGETGRVIRFDSLSKVVSAGMRLGVLTAHMSVVQRVVKITANINLQPSSTIQTIGLSILRRWGHAGFLTHCSQAAMVYRDRRDAFAAAADRYLRGRAAWELPSAGMFFWLTLHLPPGQDSFALLEARGMERKILAIPGVAFMPKTRKTCHLRVSFSLVTDYEMNEACRRIADLVDDAWKESGSPLLNGLIV